MSKKIVVGAIEHGAELRDQIVHYLKEQGYEVIETGTFDKSENGYNQLSKSLVDYQNDDQIYLTTGVCGSGNGIFNTLIKDGQSGVELIKDDSVINNSDTKYLTLGGRTHTLDDFIKAFEKYIKLHP